jgi:arylsulfatase A-like enzyme
MTWLLSLAECADDPRSPQQELILSGVFTNQGGLAWVATAPDDWPTDSVDSESSRLLVFEDGEPLGPAHALHDEIRRLGRGRYSHWEGSLYFSTSDDSDPNTNGRVYVVAQERLAASREGYRVLPLRDPFVALPPGAIARGVAAETRVGVERARGPRLVYWYTIDALRLDTLTARAGNGPLMPNLMKFGSEAVTFDRAYVQSSFTKTSTASMFTGLWPQRHGVMHGWVPTWPEGAALFFDLDNRFYTLAEYLGDRGYETWTHRFTVHVQPGSGMLQGFDHVDLNSGSDVPVPVLPERLFVYEHVLGAHGPYAPSEQARATLGLADARAIDPASTDWFYQPLDEVQLQELIAAYRAEVWDSDRDLARRLTFIREAGLWDDALIIVTSDHGEEFLDHGATQHGLQLYDEVLRVPLMVKFPAGHPWAARHGSHVQHRVRMVDLYPTIVELLGDDVAALPYQLDGKSLGPILDGTEQASPGRDVLARVSFTSVVEETGELALFVTDAIVHGPLKAVLGYRIRSSQQPELRPFAQGEWIAELYDLGGDPREKVNLIDLHAPAFEYLAEQLGRAFLPLRLPGAAEPTVATGDEGRPEADLIDALRALGYVGERR